MISRVVGCCNVVDDAVVYIAIDCALRLAVRRVAIEGEQRKLFICFCKVKLTLYKHHFASLQRTALILICTIQPSKRFMFIQ